MRVDNYKDAPEHFLLNPSILNNEKQVEMLFDESTDSFFLNVSLKPVDKSARLQVN